MGIDRLMCAVWLLFLSHAPYVNVPPEKHSPVRMGRTTTYFDAPSVAGVCFPMQSKQIPPSLSNATTKEVSVPRKGKSRLSCRRRTEKLGVGRTQFLFCLPAGSGGGVLTQSAFASCPLNSRHSESVAAPGGCTCVL